MSCSVYIFKIQMHFLYRNEICKAFTALILLQKDAVFYLELSNIELCFEVLTLKDGEIHIFEIF